MRIATVLAVLLGLTTAAWAAPAVRGEAPLDKSNSWVFPSTPDPFSPDTVLDLRSLNEKVAGGTGYVRLSEDGNSFVRGDGRPIRFWGVHATSNLDWSDADATRNARWLAKLGVNLVRCGAQLSVDDDSAKAREANEKGIRQVQRTVAVMKKAGVYTMISPIWARGNEGRLWFDPSFQKPYKALVKRLLTTPNPYTGVPLKDDPAMAFFEMCNEDNMLFYWVDRIKGEPRKLLEQKFAQWAAGKYGSVDKALAAWGGGKAEGDAPADGRLGLMVIWYGTWDGKSKDPNPRRFRDQLQFFAETEHAFGLEMKRYLRDELGCRALMDTSDFRPADQAIMGDLQNWCKSAGDLICTNSYYDPAHKGENAGWRVDPGHTFEGASALTRPLHITALKKQLVGRPYVLTETLWVPPTAYEAEAPLLLASYMGLSGLDTALIAGPRGVDWNASPYFPWWTLPGGHPMKKFDCADPGYDVQLPRRRPHPPARLRQAERAGRARRAHDGPTAGPEAAHDRGRGGLRPEPVRPVLPRQPALPGGVDAAGVPGRPRGGGDRRRPVEEPRHRPGPLHQGHARAERDGRAEHRQQPRHLHAERPEGTGRRRLPEGRRWALPAL